MASVIGAASGGSPHWTQRHRPPHPARTRDSRHLQLVCTLWDTPVVELRSLRNRTIRAPVPRWLPARLPVSCLFLQLQPASDRPCSASSLSRHAKQLPVPPTIQLISTCSNKGSQPSQQVGVLIGAACRAAAKREKKKNQRRSPPPRGSPATFNFAQVQH